jgi:hypothetical protein
MPRHGADHYSDAMGCWRERDKDAEWHCPSDKTLAFCRKGHTNVPCPATIRKSMSSERRFVPVISKASSGAGTYQSNMDTFSGARVPNGRNSRGASTRSPRKTQFRQCRDQIVIIQLGQADHLAGQPHRQSGQDAW